MKELARRMSAPRERDWKKLKRLGRYLIGKERSVTVMRRQNPVSKIDTWVDTDYAGCRDTRKSTSGGVIMVGSHLIKGWSSTQSVIALSSGEAEYYGMVKGSSTSIGLRNIMSDLGVKAAVRVRTDSSAALGVAKRRGIGQIRRIEMNQLWMQEKVSEKRDIL